MSRNKKREKVDFNLFNNESIEFGCEHLELGPTIHYTGDPDGLFRFLNNQTIESGIYKVSLEYPELFKYPSPAACHSFESHLFKIQNFNRGDHWQYDHTEMKLSEFIKLDNEIAEPQKNFYKTFFKSVNFGRALTTFYMNNLVIKGATPLKKAAKEACNILNMLPKEESKLEINESMFYFGIKFSPFSWHTEDNFCQSLNLLHCGASKIWFSVPPKYFEEFDTLSKKQFARANLEHFISPEQLQRNNIKVEYIVQNPGELIVTVAKGYHSGFSTGPNFSEALNFEFSSDLQFNLEFDESFQNFPDPYRFPKFNTGFLLLKMLNNKPEFIPLNINYIIDKFYQLDSVFQEEDTNEKKFKFVNSEARCELCKIPVRFSYKSCKTCGKTYCYIHTNIECCGKTKFKFHRQQINLQMYLK